MRKKSTIRIGKNIQKIRKSNGYTQESLAEKLEVSVRYVSDMEQDKSKPSYEILVKFCNLFHIGMDKLFSKYLTTQDNKNLDFSLSGYEKLSDVDKATIENLIMYFNKANNQNEN